MNLLPGTIRANGTVSTTRARNRSQTIMTRRYVCRSAIATSRYPPSSQGAKLMANAAAEAATESVRSKTNAVMAARAMKSPSQDKLLAA
jgi:hypothetical protein